MAGSLDHGDGDESSSCPGLADLPANINFNFNISSSSSKQTRIFFILVRFIMINPIIHDAFTIVDTYTFYLLKVCRKAILISSSW